MIQRRQRLRFAGEACQPIGVECVDLPQHFDGDIPIERRVARVTDLAHPAAPSATTMSYAPMLLPVGSITVLYASGGACAESGGDFVRVQPGA
jgi:hypothetical protein